MKIVADSSPLITLAKISRLEILPQLYTAIAILLAIELDADAVLMDDRDGRRAAWKMGVDTIWCVGVLEEAFRLKLIHDLRATYSLNLLPL